MFGFGKKRPDDGHSLTQPIPAGWEITDLGLLGAGGMARVYRVRDETLGREVAFKALRPELQNDSLAVRRFIDEARITAQLAHPNIPTVYGLAADRKRSTCFTMRVLEGRSLQQVLDEDERQGKDGLFAALDVLLRVCDAVAFAHERGVLHLDLKPSNVMVAEHGQIFVVDWGLARRKDELPAEEQHDYVPMGTPSYMPPEQALGENHALDERSDIFALGGILYRILTGRPPFLDKTAEGALELARACVVAPPAQVTKLGRPIARRLSALCQRALAAAPEERHQSVAEFRDELQAFVHGTAQLPRRRYAPGESIVREGDVGDAAYVILSGRCQASRVVAGQTQVLRELEPGSMFGETAVLTGAPRSATVKAIEETVVGIVDRPFLEDEMARTSFTALAIRTVAATFLDLNRQTAALQEEQLLERVVEQALRAIALDGVAAEDGTRRLPWAPLLAALVKSCGMPAAAVSARVDGRAGLSIRGAELVLER